MSSYRKLVFTCLECGEKQAPSRKEIGSASGLRCCACGSRAMQAPEGASVVAGVGRGRALGSQASQREARRLGSDDLAQGVL